MNLAHPGPSILLFFLVWALLSSCNGQCNTCLVGSNFACVSQTQFRYCLNGSPVGGVSSCPDGYVCSVNSTSICQPQQDNVIVACGNCNVCDASGIFACTDTQTYALCLGSGTPTNSIGSCPDNYVCNIDLAEICGNTSLGVVPTCSTAGEETTSTSTTTTTVYTTISPIKYPAKYCRNLQQYGRFPVGSDINSTCRQYVFCVVNGGVWSGQLYTCPGSTYFNSSSRLCGTNIPEDCGYYDNTSTQSPYLG